MKVAGPNGGGTGRAGPAGRGQPGKTVRGRRRGRGPRAATGRRPGARTLGWWAQGQDGEPVQERTGLAAADKEVTPGGREPWRAYQARSVVRAWVWAAADAVPDS
jgi:hypothetical protein